MNKWSLLLFSVLGILLTTKSELNFVDGRLGCCDHSSRPLLSDTRLSIYEPHCAYRSFTEISQLIPPKRDIRYDTRNAELKRSSRADGSRRQFEGRRISSDERFRVSSNVVFDLDDSTLSNTRDRKVHRENEDLYLREKIKSFSRDNFRENHVYQSRSHNNDFLGNKMERNLLERRFNIEEELSEKRDNRFRHIDGPLSVKLRDRNQERFNRRTFVIKTYNMPNEMENMDETKLSFIQKNEGKRDMESSNLDINTRQRLFRDTRLASSLVDLSRNSDRRFKTDDRIKRNGNIRNYRRLSARDDSTAKIYERESLTNVRRNIDMDDAINVYRRSYDKDISEEKIPGGSFRTRTIPKEREGLRNQIHHDRNQMNKGFEERLLEKEYYPTRGLPRLNSYINKLQEIRLNRFHKDVKMNHGEDYGNVFVERVERASDESVTRRIRENNCAIRLNEHYTVERITPSNKNSLVEKEAVSSSINRRSEAIRRSVLEPRGREHSRFRLHHENENIFEQRRIVEIRNDHNEDKVREPRNSQGFLVRDDNNRELVNRMERERLSRTGNIQRGNQYIMHTRAMNIRDSRILEDPNFNKRFVSNVNSNEEQRRSRTYIEISDRDEFRSLLVHEGRGAFAESRIPQVRDKRGDMREYRLNIGRAVERVSARIDGNTHHVVERGFLSIIPSIGNSRLYGKIRSAVTVLKRREVYEVRNRSAHKKDQRLDQRRTRDVLVDNLGNERLAERSLASRKNMNNAVLNINNNRQSNNEENNSQVILARTNQREMTNSFERERFSSVYIQREDENRMHNNYRQREHENRMHNNYRQREHENRMHNNYRQREHENRMHNNYRQREHENRMHNNYRQRANIQKIRSQKKSYVERKRIVEDRRVEVLNEKLNIRNILASENKRSFDESRTSRLRDTREFSLNGKVIPERLLVRNNNKVIEQRESRIRPEFEVNHHNQITKRTVTSLQLHERNVPSLLRLNERDLERNGNGIARNKQFTRFEDHSSNIRIEQINQVLRKTNVKSNTRGTRDKVTTRYVETEVEFHDSEKTHHEGRTEQVNRNFARHRLSINMRDLIESRSEKRSHVSRKREFIRYVRSNSGPENRAHRRNKDNTRTSDKDDNRGRDVLDRARNIRVPNGLPILNKDMRITKTRRTNEEEREITAVFSKIRPLSIEHKTQSDSKIFEMKLQYIFYMLQGLYILGLLTKFSENSNGIQKRRLSNWYLMLRAAL